MTKRPGPFIGIDPGKVNVGVAVLDKDLAFIKGQVFAPKDYANLYQLTRAIGAWTGLEGTVTIERFVPYANVFSQESEAVTKLVGALQAMYEEKELTILLPRAIDWKPFVCKHLYKTLDFRNPSKSFDKKYSLAAAKAIANQDFPNDHVADAVCQAFYGSIK